MKKFINEKADINNPKWDNLIHREKEIYKRETDLRSDFERDYNRILHSEIMILFMFIKGINPKTKLKKGMWNYGSKTYENFDYRG